jgi:hypothetical protein
MCLSTFCGLRRDQEQSGSRIRIRIEFLGWIRIRIKRIWTENCLSHQCLLFSCHTFDKCYHATPVFTVLFPSQYLQISCHTRISYTFSRKITKQILSVFPRKFIFCLNPTARSEHLLPAGASDPEIVRPSSPRHSSPPPADQFITSIVQGVRTYICSGAYHDST